MLLFATEEIQAGIQLQAASATIFISRSWAFLRYSFVLAVYQQEVHGKTQAKSSRQVGHRKRTNIIIQPAAFNANRGCCQTRFMPFGLLATWVQNCILSAEDMLCCVFVKSDRRVDLPKGYGAFVALLADADTVHAHWWNGPACKRAWRAFDGKRK